MEKLTQRIICPILVVTSTVLGGCGGGSANSTPPPTYMVGGSVSGLAPNESVILLDNAGDALSVSANGAYTFTTALGIGSTYSVTVGTQPPGQICTVAGGAGTISAQSVTDVAVTCASDTYTVGGTVTGLGSAAGLVLVNGSETLKVPPNATSFTMPTAVANGTAYNVAVQVDPTALSCTVISGAGTVNGADVTSISISCASGTESVLYSFSGGPLDGANPDGALIQASDGNFYGMTQFGGAKSDGVIFKITPGGTETVLHSFQGGTSDGAYPLGDLVQASDGNFYGVTANGGGSGYGTVFKVTPGGTETVLYSFKGGATDGAYPHGSLIQASDGNFYGMTNQGGSYNAVLGGDGVIFEITPAGNETVLHSFGGPTTDGAYPVGSLVQGSDGNFYGMTQDGGANNSGTVFKVTSGGSETVLHSFGPAKDGDSPGGSLIQGSDGSFYGLTFQGGVAAQGGVVFKITASGAETVLYAFQGGLYATQGATSDGGNPSGDLIQASDGNLYAMTQYGGADDDGAIVQITTSGAETVLYSFQGTTTDGSSPRGSLIQASDGELYGMTNSGGASNLGTIFRLN